MRGRISNGGRPVGIIKGVNMDVFDKTYSEIIYELFDIKLNSRKEIDAFYKDIDKKLTKVQILQLQFRVADALNFQGDGA